MKYISHSEKDISIIKKTIGIKDIKDLFSDIPVEIKENSAIKINNQFDDLKITQYINKLNKSNKRYELNFSGGGFYNHYIPPIVDELSSRGEFYTSYTPYQGEISQGFLQAIFEYQTMMCRLTKMDISNASLYDGATALAESIIMALKKFSHYKTTNIPQVLVSSLINPVYKKVLLTYLKYFKCLIKFIDYDSNGKLDLNQFENYLKDNTDSILVISQPNYFGIIENYEEILKLKIKYKFISIASVYPISLGLIKPPGDYDFDIVTAEGQSLGNYLYYGGPLLGILCAKNEFIRNLPGRIVGETVDKTNQRAWVLTLQTREQHIRREKATSNICSNQALCALRTAIYLSFIGKNGFKQISLLNHQHSEYFKKIILNSEKVKLKFNSETYNEFLVEFEKESLMEKFYNHSVSKGIIPGIKIGKYFSSLNNCLLINTTELHNNIDYEKYLKLLKEC